MCTHYDIKQASDSAWLCTAHICLPHHHQPPPPTPPTMPAVGSAKALYHGVSFTCLPRMGLDTNPPGAGVAGLSPGTLAGAIAGPAAAVLLFTVGLLLLLQRRRQRQRRRRARHDDDKDDVEVGAAANAREGPAGRGCGAPAGPEEVCGQKEGLGGVGDISNSIQLVTP